MLIGEKLRGKRPRSCRIVTSVNDGDAFKFPKTANLSDFRSKTDKLSNCTVINKMPHASKNQVCTFTTLHASDAHLLLRTPQLECTYLEY